MLSQEGGGSAAAADEGVAMTARGPYLAMAFQRVRNKDVTREDIGRRTAIC